MLRGSTLYFVSVSLETQYPGYNVTITVQKWDIMELDAIIRIIPKDF